MYHHPPDPTGDGGVGKHQQSSTAPYHSVVTNLCPPWSTAMKFKRSVQNLLITICCPYEVF